MRFRSLVLATATFAAAAAVGLPAAASAAAPIRETVQLTRNVPAFAPCDGFVVKATFELDPGDHHLLRRGRHAGPAPDPRHDQRGAQQQRDRLLASEHRRPQLPVRPGRAGVVLDRVQHRRPPARGRRHNHARARADCSSTTPRGRSWATSGPTDDGDYAALCAALS